MKFCFAILILILPVLSAHGDDKHMQEFNAYRIVFLDGDSKPVATATVFAPSISSETTRQEATAFIEELENKKQAGPGHRQVSEGTGQSSMGAWNEIGNFMHRTID